MKKFLALILTLAFTVCAFADIGLVNRSNTLKYDGTVDSNALEQKFINVYNRHAATVAVGTAMVLDVTNDDGASVSLSTTVGVKPICVMAVSCASGKLCLCQTYGYFSAALFDVTKGNAVAGKRAWLSTDNAGYLAARGTDLATEASIGVFYDAASASGTIELFIAP